ncbi:RodZ domain-containing protein [Croceicoccus sp. BE223]|uniref:helix-turn-helix domain-containing protein n=1 Tax=Croceicoccus sp. BE223 TaxID=2817716 RepID=UPI00285D3AFC|nr:RodZ domain-containing protein [Croceicoccus sp. BE223]MDR7101999.1 cytoskeletal protein RodZ [Croceicoccus sp. BE223]
MDEGDIDTGNSPESEDAAVPGDGVGGTLKAERERQGLSLDEMGERTKIAKRHLLALEEGRFADLPGKTYAIGFARSYARALGIDEAPVVEGVRDDLGVVGAPVPTRNIDYLEPGDPARIPSAALAWGVAALFVIILVVGFFAFRGYFMPASELPALEQPQPTVAAAPGVAPAATPAPAPTGDVTFTATADAVWVKFYDRTGKQLFQKEMALNESFTVPAGADGPQLWTGRPDALKITIGGRQVPPLATEQRTMRDVPVDAASLTARQSTPATPVPGQPRAPAG